MDINYYLEESGNVGGSYCPDYASYSRQPSPLPYLLPTASVEPRAPSLWLSRYTIHNEAFSDLSTSFATLHDTFDPSLLRYIISPLLILALVSRANSPERALCQSYLANYRKFMSTTRASDDDSCGDSGNMGPVFAAWSPLGGRLMERDIPWDVLDTFSELAELQRWAEGPPVDPGLIGSAPEWNWYDMLGCLKMESVCKCCLCYRHDYSCLVHGIHCRQNCSFRSSKQPLIVMLEALSCSTSRN